MEANIENVFESLIRLINGVETKREFFLDNRKIIIVSVDNDRETFNVLYIKENASRLYEDLDEMAFDIHSYIDHFTSKD